jgi:DNA helicase-2/ATP-dependent DNA helicase PcrA
MSRLLARLNPEQRLAAETTEGPVLVLAGAGTGKTRVITYRIAHMLEKGISPDAVLAMTFTNKAAGEMRERVAELVGKERAKLLTVGTFHAFCVRALRQHAKALGMPRGFSICDASDQLSAIKGALRELHVPEATMRPRDLHSRISLLKNKLVTADAFLDQAHDDEDQLIGRAYKKYDENLRRARSLDFDDLLVKMVELLREHHAIRDAYRTRFKYVLVDEFQDTNKPQFEIVRGIADGHRNLCVVGDDDQSIYGWRGAEVKQILEFDKRYPGGITVRLETNYRSTQPILDAANSVISNNPARHDKALRSHLGAGEDVSVVVHEDEEKEAESVVFDIVGKMARRQLPYSDFAVLFRTAPQARAFEMSMRAHDIPYVLVGGMSFFDRKEIRDLLAYVKLMVNPLDEVSFLRVVNTPPRGVGKSSIDRLLDFATKRGISVPQALDRPGELTDIPAAAMQAMQGLRAKLARLAQGARGRELVHRLGKLIDEIDYQVEMVRCYPDEGTRELRQQAIQEFLNMAENYVRRAESPSLGGFLEEVALAESDDRSDGEERSKDAVTLMTLHAAKGLEFPHVYLVGMEEGILPHQKAVKESGDEEERRLAYVGITRAQKRLTLTYAATRARYGKRYETMPSRFLFEMRGEVPPAGWQPAGAPAEARGDGPVAPPSGTKAGTPQAERAISAPPPRRPTGRSGGKRSGSRRRGASRGRPVPPGLRDAMQRRRRR